MKKIFFILSVVSVLYCSGQTTAVGSGDSTFRLFPNPVHDRFYVTSESRIIQAMIVSLNGSKRMEYLSYEIPYYQNQFGLGCLQAGCIGAYLPSNFISVFTRKNLENGLFYFVMIDETGHVYHSLLYFLDQ